MLWSTTTCIRLYHKLDCKHEYFGHSGSRNHWKDKNYPVVYPERPCPQLQMKEGKTNTVDNVQNAKLCIHFNSFNTVQPKWRIHETFSTQFVGKKFTDSWRALGKNLLKFHPRATISFQKLVFFWERVAALSLGLTLRAKPQNTTVLLTVSPKSTTATYTSETPTSNYTHKI